MTVTLIPETLPAAVPAALRDRWSSASRGTRLLVVLFGLHVLVKLLLFTQVGGVGLCCDQVSYDDGARVLSNAIRDLASFGPVDTAELQRNLVGGGWFTPGSSIALTPLYLVLPDAGTGAIRAYLGVFSTLLLLYTVLRVRAVLGDRYAAILLVVPGLVPMYLLFSYAAWGDLLAGLLCTVLLMEAITLMRTIARGESPSWRDGVRFGLAAIAVVYARSSTSVVVLGLGVVLGLTVLVVLRGRIRVRAVLSFVVAGVTFLAVLAPWTAFASHTLGARVITTSTVPVVLANTFGDRDLICYSRCDDVQDAGSVRGNIWFAPMQYSREVQRATGRSEVEVEQQMWANTRPSVTPQSLSYDVFGNTFRYAVIPASFTRLLTPAGTVSSPVGWVIIGLTYLGWLVLLGSGIALLLARLRRSPDLQVVALLTSVGILSLFTQPFVHVGTGRYWTTVAPLMGIAFALLLTAREQRRADRDGPDVVGSQVATEVATLPAATTRWFTIVQTLVGATFVVTVVSVVVLGLSYSGRR